jgi:hypothetical protein
MAQEKGRCREQAGSFQTSGMSGARSCGEFCNARSLPDGYWEAAETAHAEATEKTMAFDGLLTTEQSPEHMDKIANGKGS